MDCSLSNSKSKMFISVAIILVLHASPCSSIQCDPANEYQLVQNKTSGEILKCPKCRACKSGFEPEPPCGTVIGIEDSIGNCKPCKDGYYSANEDVLQCQQCQSAKCFTHQIVVEICKIDEPDTSRCTSRCRKGYVMNSNGTACEVDKLQKITVTTKDPTLSNKTDGETGLSVAEIILIVICSLLIVTLSFVGLCWYFNCRNSRHTQRGKDVENSSANTSTTLLNETKDEGNGTIILQEEDQQNGLPTSDGPHVMETTGGFVDSSQSNNVRNDISDAVMGYTAPLNNFVVNNVLAMSPAPQNIPPEPLNPQNPPAAMAPNYFQVNNPHLTRFDDLSSTTYDKICVMFDGGPPGKNWRALAGWLGLLVEDVKPIEIKENKTNQVIQRWAVATENTVAKFFQILEENGMTYLADEIKTELTA